MKRLADWGAAPGLKRPDHGAAAREYVPPRVVDSLPAPGAGGAPGGEVAHAAATDFTRMSEEDLRAYLDRRGEDCGDCVDVYALAARAAEIEAQQPAAPAVPADSDDPLDAFMADIDSALASAASPPPRAHAAALGCDDDDATGEYIAAHAAARAAKTAVAAPDLSGYGSDEEVYATAAALDGGEDGAPTGKAAIDPLPPVRHDLLSYPAFERGGYDEHPEVFAMDEAEVVARRSALQLTVTGPDVPRLVSTFEQCGFDRRLTEAIAKAGFREPTAIQAQALPVCLSPACR